MNAAEVRKKYLEFFEKRGHTIIPSASLVPENDPTTLFTGSGMQPLIPYLLGQKHPSGTRLTNSQKCFRAEDIEEVGDNRHTTFFEMLGNWSLGDYFKQEQLSWFFSFLTGEIKLDPNRFYVTVFAGDPKNNIPKDEEAVAIWKKLFSQKGIEAKDVELLTEKQGGKLGMQNGRIFYYGSKKNWWSRAGVPENMPAGEPGGPDSEMFYEFVEIEHDTKFGKHCHPNCDCGRFLEIGNSVFMEYKKAADGSFEKLKQKNVDFGGGLERITAASNDDSDIFKIDSLWSIIKKMQDFSRSKYEGESKKSFRIVADHIRAVCFMIADGVMPTNTERGYFVRRLLRRAVYHADVLGIMGGTLCTLLDVVVASYRDVYPELVQSEETVKNVIREEEEKFRKTFARGMKKFEEFLRVESYDNGESGELHGEYKIIPTDIIFHLVTTDGFPLESVREIAKERGLFFDENAFQEAMQKHKKISRAGSEKKFKGGLADTKEETVRLHTAHHLLLASLQKILGDHVKQRGSNITAERLRIDFSHSHKMTSEEIQKVEDLVNEKIGESLNMVRREISKEEALKIGAQMEFGAKYGDVVSVYFAENDRGDVFSKEFCGGPHVKNTDELGHFRIIKEEAVSAGIRRIKAILE